MRFTRGDIVLSAVGWKEGCFVITGYNPSRPKNCYEAINVVNRKKYNLSDESLGIKIGTATEEFLSGGGETASLSNVAFERGQRRAEYMAHQAFGSTSKAQWGLLAKAKPGDWLDVRLNGRQQRVKFNHVIESGSKYVFNATNLNGTTYRYPLEILIVPNAVKRTEAEILADFRRVESALSPENLTCDGELPRSQWLAKSRQLEAERSRLIAELGREPSLKELYNLT